MPTRGFDEATAPRHDELRELLRERRARPEVSWADRRGAHRRPVEGRALVGAADAADIVVDDPAVSRLHAELEARDDGVWVRDLGSTNGTFVGPVLVREARLPEGGVLRVGAAELLVRYEAEPAEVALWPTDRFGPLVGGTRAMRELFARLDRVAATDATVLVQGETGTGKELVARALHDASPRRGGPFVVVDCGALAEPLLEAELFGHAKGAFTGAAAARAGAIEAADGGTVFFDEVGELPLAVQPKLLRAIEARSVRRLGETDYRRVNVRFVSATHRDLRRMVNEGAFREDLYFRLAVVPVAVPPLRERRDDIARLVASFAPPRAPRLAEPALLEALARRPWLGNVRELRNFVERALALGPDEALALDAPRSPDGAGAPLPDVPLDVPFKDLRERWNDHLERAYLGGLLARHGGNVAAAAEAAGLDRSYVHRLLRRHGLRRGP